MNQFENFTELTFEEMQNIEGGGVIKNAFKKLGEAWAHARDCFNGCDCQGCSDPGARNTVRFLM